MASRNREELVLTSLGELYKGPNERKYWSSKRGRDRYPYPVGYQATRLQGGHEYRLEVAEGIEGPDFVVTDPRGVQYVAETALRVWSIALRANGRAGSVKENTDGGEVFGFTMVKKYLQDMVARTGGPAPGAPEASSTPLSPLACNTPTVSGRSRSGTSKPAPGSLPAKRPASTRRGRGDPNKSKGESLKPASVAGKVSPDDTGGHVAAINPLQGDDNASLTRKSNSGAKRQKLGDLKFASPDGLRVAEAQTGEPLCTEAARATSAGLGKRCSGRSPTVTEACPSQGAETEAPKEAAQKHLRLVSVEGKALLARKKELQKSLQANNLALACSRKARQKKLVKSRAPDERSPPVQDDRRDVVAKAERAEGACQNKKDPENDSVAEQEASVALSEANEGSRAGGAVGDSERTTETEEPIGSAGHGEDGVTEEGVVRASEEDGQTEQQQVNSAGKRAADESGSLGPGDAEKECERETASPHLPECLESSAGRSKGELLGETSTDGGQRLPRKSETQRPSRAADSPPSGAGKPEVQARGPEVRQRCPNHLEGDEHVPRTVDMEAETEPESDASQSADLREEGIGSGGAAEVQSALAERAADVSSPAAGEGAHAHELVEAAAASRGRAEGKATGEEGLVGGKLFETTLPDGSEEVRQGTTSDYHGGSRVQRKFEDDSTEPPDVSPVSPAFGQRERGPASPHVEIAPERKPSTVDFEADKAGWFTAARGRKGFLVGLTKETVKLDASGGVGACALAVDGAAVAGEKITTKRKLDAVDDRVIEETEQQETESRAGIDRNGPAVRSNLGGVRSRDLGVRGEQASDRVGGLGSLSGNANDGASVGDRKTAGPLRGVATKSLSEQGVQVGERFQQAAAVGAVGVEDEEGPAAAGLRSGSPVRGGGTQEGKRKVKRLSLTPFKRWKAAGEGDDAAEKVKDDVAGGGGIAGQPVSEHGKGPANLSGATKRKMAELGTLAAFGWEAEKERRAAASGVGQAGREEQGKITQLEPDVSEGGVGLRSESGGTVTAECGRSKESGLGCGLEPGPENWETDEVAAAVTSAEKAVHDGLENEGREQTAALEGRRVDGLTRGPGEKPAVRIVGSDSLTEQQSELQCSEPESKEGEEPAELEQAAGTIAASAGFAEAGGEYSVPALQGGGVECLEQKLRPTSKVLPVEKEPDGDDREDADQVEGTGPKASENDGSSAVRKGGLMPLNPHVNAPPTRPLSGRLGEPAERGRPASPVTQRQRSPKAPPQGASSPPPPSERSHSSSWIGRTVETISAAFRAPAGYKPLALTRSRDPVVSNGATGPPAPKDDTAEEDWPGKSRPRNKSWPVWKGPTSNPNLGKVGGSAQKAPPAGARGEGPEVPKAAEIIAVTSALGANRGRALESQARRLGRFEESEAVRDWPAGELLVPSTPPDTPAEETPSKEEDHAGDPSKAEAAPGEGPEEGGLVPRGGGLMGGLKSGSGEAGQGLLRPVCCLVQQKGPVLWSVIHVASREVRLGVCVETDKAQRSVFVYSLSKGVEQGEWKVAVAGEIAGTVRPSEGLEQVTSPGAFLQFSPNGDVVVLTDALSFQELGSTEAASKRPCLRLVSLVEQRPQLLGRLDCGSTSSCLLVTGPRTLAAGMQQGVVECWTMKPDWRSSDEKWTLPVARYRGVTFPAINHLLHIPGRPHQLLGCSENGSFAIWDVRARTLLSTCHSMHYLVASAAVLSGQVLLPKEPSRATSAGTPIHTTAEVRPQAEEADSVKPLCLLLRATARGYPEQGAACLPALLSGDEIVVGKELLVAERAVHVAGLGASGVAVDGEGRVLLWDATTGRAFALLKDLEGAPISCLSTHEGAGILAVGCQDGRLAIYSRCEVPADHTNIFC